MENNLKLYREQIGLTQEELAKKLSVTKLTIIAIENNKYNPTIELALKIAKFLEVSVGQLFVL